MTAVDIEPDVRRTLSKEQRRLQTMLRHLNSEIQAHLSFSEREAERRKQEAAKEEQAEERAAARREAAAARAQEAQRVMNRARGRAAMHRAKAATRRLELEQRLQEQREKLRDVAGERMAQAEAVKTQRAHVRKRMAEAKAEAKRQRAEELATRKRTQLDQREERLAEERRRAKHEADRKWEKKREDVARLRRAADMRRGELLEREDQHSARSQALVRKRQDVIAQRKAVAATATERERLMREAVEDMRISGKWSLAELERLATISEDDVRSRLQRERSARRRSLSSLGKRPSTATSRLLEPKREPPAADADATLPPALPTSRGDAPSIDVAAEDLRLLQARENEQYARLDAQVAQLAEAERRRLARSAHGTSVPKVAPVAKSALDLEMERARDAAKYAAVERAAEREAEARRRAAQLDAVRRARTSEQAQLRAHHASPHPPATRRPASSAGKPSIAKSALDLSMEAARAAAEFTAPPRETRPPAQPRSARRPATGGRRRTVVRPHISLSIDDLKLEAARANVEAES